MIKKKEGDTMDKDTFKKQWKKFLIDIDMSETQLANELGVKQATFNEKMRNATIKYIELSNIVEKYGYTIEIRKKE